MRHLAQRHGYMHVWYMPAIPPRPGTVAREEVQSGVPARGVDDLRAEGEQGRDDLAEGALVLARDLEVAEVAPKSLVGGE
jgi:hypothetical protein